MEEKPRILIVDDEEDLLEAYESLFEMEDFIVRLATGGTEAFQLFQDESFDILLTDIRMPKGNGIDLIKNVKRVKPELPIVCFITGGMGVDERTAYHVGAGAIFSKPVDVDPLLAHVRAALVPEADRVMERQDVKAHLQEPSQVVFGRGGMAVQAELHCEVGDFVEFDLSGELALKGQARVLWYSDDGGDKYGLEFTFLEESCRQLFRDWASQNDVRSYIPDLKEE